MLTWVILRHASTLNLIEYLRNMGMAYFGEVFVGSQIKGWISKRVFQENKARQIFPENEHFLLPDTHTWRALCVCVCESGGKSCSFFGKFGVLCFPETLVSRFAVLPHYRRNGLLVQICNQIYKSKIIFKINLNIQ